MDFFDILVSPHLSTVLESEGQWCEYQLNSNFAHLTMQWAHSAVFTKILFDTN